MERDYFGAQDQLVTSLGDVKIWRLGALEDAGLCTLGTLPYSIRALLESVLRQADMPGFTE